MDFSEALLLMKQGKGVRRECWIDDTFIRIADDDRFRDEEGFDYIKQQCITEDILADDWEEVTE